MKLVGRKAEQFSISPNPDCWAILVHGDDDGVVSDACENILSAWTKPGDTEVQILDEDAVKRDTASFFDALEAQSLFGGKSVLRLRCNGDKIAALIVDALGQSGADRRGDGTKLLISNNSLGSRSKMRVAFEGHSTVAALQVFADSEADLKEHAARFFATRNVEIESDAMDYMLGALPPHRGLANAELEKFSLYAVDLERPLNVQDIHSLTEVGGENSARGVVDLMLSGAVLPMHEELDRLFELGASVITLLRATEYECRRLLAAHSFDRPSAEIGRKLRPPVWPNEWPAFAKKLNKWPAERLSVALQRVADLELMAKSNAGAAEASTRVLMTNLGRSAA